MEIWSFIETENILDDTLGSVATSLPSGSRRNYTVSVQSPLSELDDDMKFMHQAIHTSLCHSDSYESEKNHIT